MPDQNKNFNRPLVDDEMINIIKNYEGDVPYMYRDAKGNVTAGLGLHLRREEDALRYPFKAMISEKEFGRLATQMEKRDAYKKVQEQPYGQGYISKRYNPFENKDLLAIGLDPAASREETRRILLQEEGLLKSKMRDFDAIPHPARQALLDMQYNIGDKKFRREYQDDNNKTVKAWPKLFDALEAKDYKRASEEVRSSDVGDDRNGWRKNKMLEAERLKNTQ
ncbi:MAG: hypothetical protein DI551_04520 [Micavibrio aeruginosavorus]|uniref:Lysozyme n=1 Tax=Micavibrio aeruginosavorus TaxID=349221 RepID=A0A2W5N2F6_9BACT|nr:MAG: hypothetical protein DI551_04520 [Micavibrio aeruginosavorus]